MTHFRYAGVLAPLNEQEFVRDDAPIESNHPALLVGDAVRRLAPGMPGVVCGTACDIEVMYLVEWRNKRRSWHRRVELLLVAEGGR